MKQCIYICWCQNEQTKESTNIQKWELCPKINPCSDYYSRWVLTFTQKYYTREYRSASFFVPTYWPKCTHNVKYFRLVIAIFSFLTKLSLLLWIKFYGYRQLWLVSIDTYFLEISKYKKGSSTSPILFIKDIVIN